MFSTLTGASCHCGALLSFTADAEPLPGACAVIRGTAQRSPIYTKVTCDSCGAVYDPNHKKFAGAYNEAVDRVARRDSS